MRSRRVVRMNRRLAIKFRRIRDVNRVSTSGILMIGAASSAVVSLVFHFARMLGWTKLNIELLLGSLFTAEIGPKTWWVGFAALLAVGAAASLAYGFIFRSARRSGAGVGVNLSLFHWGLSGIAVGILPAFHPLVAERLPAPGFYMLGEGLHEGLAFFAAHLLFGGMVGSLFDLAAIRDEYPESIASARPVDAGHARVHHQ